MTGRTFFLGDTAAWEFMGASWRLLPHAPATEDPPWAGVYGCFAGWDARRQRIVGSVLGDEMLEYDPGWTSRPALELRLPMSLTGLPADTRISQVSVRVRAGGTGFSGWRNTTQGVRVDAWRDGAWVPLATAAFPANSPGWLSAPLGSTTTELAAVGAWATGTVHPRVVPVGTNGASPALVKVDYAELRVALDAR